MRKAPIGYLPLKHKPRKQGDPNKHALIALALVTLGFILTIWPR